MNGAEAIAAAFAAAGVPAVFGVPGGGSSLDLLAAAKARGIPFHLARTEAGAVTMALATAELAHRPAAALVTRGPGVAAAANGLANASLERAPLVLVADGLGTAESRFATHQRFDQAAMAAPLTRAQAHAGEGAGAAAHRALLAALGAPRGPAYLELPGDAARAPAEPPPPWRPPALPPPSSDAVARARAMLAAARRPAIIAGLEATAPARCAWVRALAEALHAPVLVTYKAKGVLPDAHPLFGGVFTGGAAEAPLLHEADLILLAGADPVEFIPQPWRFAAPVLDLADWERGMDYAAPALRLAGAWEAADLAPTRAAWPDGAIARHRRAWLAALENGPSGNRGLSPSAIVRGAQAAARQAGADPRAAVDAGAHMFPCTSFWQAERPGDLLISNGLATMGHALPAAIAAAIHDPGRGALAFTGDGGLLMAMGELATACALRLRLVVVVFNDAALSLIGIKTGGRDLPARSLDWPECDFAQVMRGLGGQAWRAGNEAELAAALRAAFECAGPALVDARCDPSSYARQIAALRG
ncbi:thiamine pyrophosphate-dependent enzyme [Roseococcus sp. DSY-14]|uniref:thiamine pyrophosphate-dependent enzyme n=1 Tax=Roseococcus sp. DSY-14 TaxID=3369650 RepID=UPI00387B3D84